MHNINQGILKNLIIALNYIINKGAIIMSFPNIPPVKPEINIDREDVISLLLASIAFEELGLAHIINAEAEKIQFVLGTLDASKLAKTVDITELLKINRSVEQTLRSVIKNQMLLQFKLEDVLVIAESENPT